MKFLGFKEYKDIFSSQEAKLNEINKTDMKDVANNSIKQYFCNVAKKNFKGIIIVDEQEAQQPNKAPELKKASIRNKTEWTGFLDEITITAQLTMINENK